LAPIPALQLATAGLRFGLRPDGSNPPQPSPQTAYTASAANTSSATGRNNSLGQAGRPQQPIQIDPSLLPPAFRVQKSVVALPNSRVAAGNVLGPITGDDAEDEQAINVDRDDDEGSQASDSNDEDDGSGDSSDEDAGDGRIHRPSANFDNENYDDDEFNGIHDNYENGGEEESMRYPSGVDIGTMNTVSLCLRIY